MGKGNFWAPYKLLELSKIYYFWLVCTLLCGLLNLWAYGFLGSPELILVEFANGIIYTFSISTCAPYIVSFSLEMLDDKRKRQETHFMGYKVPIIIANALFIMILTVLWLGEYKSSIGIQILICVITIGFSFYMYCVSEMSNHYEYFKEYDDKSYLNSEKGRMSKTSENADKISGEDILNWRKKNGKKD